MKIGQLATATGVSRDSLRFYEAQGLIQARRLENGYRDYSDEVQTLVHYIKTAQKLGFTLAEVGHKMPSVWNAPEPGPAVERLLAEKLQDIDERIDALRALREQLASRIAMACPLMNSASVEARRFSPQIDITCPRISPVPNLDAAGGG